MTGLPLDEPLRRMVEVDSAGVLTRSSIDLGHNLGLHAVAEGVEDPDPRPAGGVGCDLAQGFLFAQPMEAAALDGWLSGRHMPDLARRLGWTSSSPSTCAGLTGQASTGR